MKLKQSNKKSNPKKIASQIWNIFGDNSGYIHLDYLCTFILSYWI